MIARLFPFLHDFSDYSLRDFKGDFLAALTLTPMAAPLAMAYAVIAGVPPQYGIYTCMLPVIVAVLFTLVYALGGNAFLGLLTDDRQVIAAAADYFPWAVAIPAAGIAAFIWDGVFIGATATRPMLLSMAVAAACFFAVYFGLRPIMGNHALWLAFLLYLLMRGLVQTWLGRSVELKKFGLSGRQR